MVSVASPLPPSLPAPQSIAVDRTFGNYKEQASGAQSYNKKLEEEGDANRPKANVFRPSSRNTEYAYKALSMSIICQHGTPMKSMLRFNHLRTRSMELMQTRVSQSF